MRRIYFATVFGVASRFVIRRRPLRLLLASFLVVSLVAPSVVFAGPWSGWKSKGWRTQDTRPGPVPGPPAANLPNLDEVRARQQPVPRAPEPIPSTIRSPHNPLVPRNGRRVGDTLPIGTNLNAKDPSYSAKVGDENSPRPRADASAHSASTVLSSSPLSQATGSDKVKMNHARITRTPALSPPPVGDDQFVQNFYQWALPLSPTSTEPTYWNDMLRTAYAHGQSSVVMAARELGKTVFESSDYAARARSDHDYVYDLYKTYLMRDPDQGGWDAWTAAVPLYGREQVRRGFDESTEFQNLMATMTPNGGITSAVSSLLTARVDPGNQPGNGLLTRDAQWSVPLLSLPGRAGLDLGLSLSYSSMVWTRSGPYIYFDEDNGWPSPGFRLGFPTIQEMFFDAQIGQNAYVLISAGGRVELRQVGTSNVYEAADSSYMQLIDYGNSLLVRTSDGTQLNYSRFNTEWRCTQIKDRNGNYISVNYDWLGHITNVTDTLGRVITFNYDVNVNLSSITQTWNGQTHTWASFGWNTLPMSPGFSGVAVVGAPNNSVIPVLVQVGLDDSTHYNFEYNSSGQATFIRSYRSDNVQRAYTAFDYESPAADCPRLSATRVWAENWTGVNGVPSEVSTHYIVDGDGAHRLTAPDGTIYKEYYGSGWQKGLTTSSEIWSGGVPKKWTTTDWTQDNTAVNYQLNPRPTESNIYDDAGNRRRTTISYNSVAVGATTCHLPEMVREYAPDA